MRDKLIELIDNNKACNFECDCYECQYDNETTCFSVRLADALIANGVTFAEDNNVPGKRRTLSFSIEEGMGKEGASCSRVSVQYSYKGELYGSYVDFNKAELDEEDIAEAFRGLADDYLLAREQLRKEENYEP